MGMTTLKAHNCKTGMRVLLTNPDPGYNIGASNPAAGTDWEQIGTVTDYGSHSISVNWDNGNHNCYKSNELSLANGGICQSIWKDKFDVL